MALINKMNILKVWLNVVMFNRPPYIDTPASKGLIYKLLNKVFIYISKDIEF